MSQQPVAAEAIATMTTETAAMEATATAQVDEQLYSRQLYVMGHEAQRRMMASHVLIIGMSGLGAEVAKNCILAGVSSITLHDPMPATYFDLGGNFYLSEQNAGQPRAEACRDALARLNPHVTVQVASASAATSSSNSSSTATTGSSDAPSGTESLLHKDVLLSLLPGKTCVVITIPLEQSVLQAINVACRQECNASFIYATVNGVFASIFCDFGPSFTVVDKDGNPPATSQVESILFPEADGQGQPPRPVVKVLEDQGRHGLETNDVVTFARLNNHSTVIQEDVPYKVNVTGPYTFELLLDETEADSTTGITTDADTTTTDTVAITQGYITQVKQPVTMHFDDYATALENASSDSSQLMLSDFAKMDRPALLHLAYKALAHYWEQNGHGQYPLPGDLNAAQQVYEIAKSMDSGNGDGDTGILANDDDGKKRRIVQQLALNACSVISPMCAAVGGIVGQEVLKACSGKFTPISGFLYLDADECLPDEPLPLEQVRPQSCRYDSQIAIFGKDAQEQFLQLNYFLIGAGAIGCEMLKNWALMGVACGQQGRVYVTDMDRIEKSNLSRQFLFRNTDIDKFKSTTAAEAVQAMNPHMNITAYQEKVASETEHLFGDDFYDKLDGVCTALDNVEARLYVDQKCVFYRLPMLESGTLGTKGNTQVVVPHLTENYGATRDPPEKSIPVCTLKNFPNQIQHTLQWARDYFEGEFKQSAEEVNTYLSMSPEAYMESLQPNTKLETLKILQTMLVDERPVTFEDCVVWARLKFETLFNNQIRQLLHNFPPDQITSSGTKFWSGSKRCPKALVFDLDDTCGDANMRNHFDFVVAAANLRASLFGIVGRTDEEYFRETLKNVIVPDFAPQEGVKIAANDAEEEKNKDDQVSPMATVDSEVEEIWASLPKQGELAGFQLNPIDFDKDIDDHMLFVTACSNLRALNYSIPTEDTHRSRAIAGRIIPAIATTTALVTGLICLELYKIVGTPRKQLTLEAFKNGFVNLAIPFMTLSEPTPPAKTKAMLKGKEWEWTPWDSLDMNLGDITMGQFMDHFENEYNLEISMLSYGVSILYSFFANKKKVEERKAMKMTEVIRSITKKEFPPNQLFIILEVIANDLDTDEEVELPYIRFRFR